jgi:hypothetical protein
VRSAKPSWSTSPLDERLDHGGLVRKVGVDGVRGDADPPGDAPHGRRVGAAVVEQIQRRIEDLVLAEGSTWTPTALRSGCRHWCDLPP